MKRTFTLSQTEPSSSQMPRLKRTKRVAVVKRKRSRSSAKRVDSGVAFYKRQSALLLKYPGAINPLPEVLKTKFTYPITTIEYAPVAANGVINFVLNSIYDFDYDNLFGNVQPLQYDQLLGAKGPYQKYRVTGWRVKFTVDNVTQFTSGANAHGLDVMLCQGRTVVADVDTWSELRDQPGVQHRLLQWYGGGNMARCVMEINGTPGDFVTKDIKDDSLAGTYTASPSQAIYGTLGLQNTAGSGSSNISAVIQLHAEFDVELFDMDGLQS